MDFLGLVRLGFPGLLVRAHLSLSHLLISFDASAGIANGRNHSGQRFTTEASPVDAAVARPFDPSDGL